MTDISELSFEDAYRELEQVINQLEAGELTLEESVAMYERGQRLSVHCQDLLDRAELRIHKINQDGETTPL